MVDRRLHTPAIAHPDYCRRQLHSRDVLHFSASTCGLNAAEIQSRRAACRNVTPDLLSLSQTNVQAALDQANLLSGVRNDIE